MDIESTNIMPLAKSMNTSEHNAYYSVNIGDIIRLKTKDFIMNKDECSIEDMELENNYTVATDSDFLNEIGINDFDVQQKYEQNRHYLYALMGSVSMFAYMAVGVITGEHMLQQSTIESLTSERIWVPVLVNDCLGIVSNFHKPKHIKAKAKRDGEASKTPQIYVYSRLFNLLVLYSICTNIDCDNILLTNS